MTRQNEADAMRRNGFMVLPAASAYEKSGTFTNTCGDLQLLKKAGDITGIKSDFEIIVRVAERMGAEVRKLVPFGSGVRADMGQTRGAQSGEADRHSVWLAANNLEPRLSPFDPYAMLDEIQRLVPGYEFSRAEPARPAMTSTCTPPSAATQAPAMDWYRLSRPMTRCLLRERWDDIPRRSTSVIENHRAPSDKEVMAD